MSRGRRLRRGLVLGVVALALLGLAAAATVRVYGTVRLRRAEHLFVRDVGPLDCRAYAPAQVPVLRNAAPLLLGGAQAIVVETDPPNDDSERPRIGRLSEQAASAWSSEDRGVVRAVLARNAAALALLRQARAYPGSSLGLDYWRGAGARLPNLLKAIHSSQLLAVEAALAMEENDLGRAIDDVETLGRQAQAYTGEPLVMTVLVGTAIERRQLAAASAIAASPFADGPLLTRLQSSIQGADLRAAYRRALGFEAASIRKAVSEPWSVQPDDNAPLPSPLPLPGRLLLAVAGPLVAARMLDQTRQVATVISDTEPAMREALEWNRAARRLPYEPDFPNLLNGASRMHGTESLRRLARAAIDLRLAALAAGRYPETLPTEHGRPEPFRGEPLRYERRPDGSAVLEVPGAAEAWKRITSGPECPFRVSLPPPSAVNGPARNGGGARQRGLGERTWERTW